MAGLFHALLRSSSSKSLFLGAIATCSTASIVYLQSETTKPAVPKSYTRQQVQNADGTNGKPTYVTFHGAVYDISEFQNIHPGGNLIKQAAGGDVEPFWNKWRYHYHTGKVQETLEELKIGYLIEDTPTELEIELDYSTTQNTTLTQKGLFKEERYTQNDDLYQTDPVRSDEHKILLQKPFTSETKPDVLVQNYLTPASALYVRNHAPVPTELHPDVNNEWDITFTNNHDGNTVPQTLSIHDILTKFTDEISVVSILQCAGNRAAEDITATGKTGFIGTPYEFIDSGMVGNVLWTGVSLKQVLVSQEFIQFTLLLIRVCF